MPDVWKHEFRVEIDGETVEYFEEHERQEAIDKAVLDGGTVVQVTYYHEDKKIIHPIQDGDDDD